MDIRSRALLNICIFFDERQHLLVMCGKVRNERLCHVLKRTKKAWYWKYLVNDEWVQTIIKPFKLEIVVGCSELHLSRELPFSVRSAIKWQVNCSHWNSKTSCSNEKESSNSFIYQLSSWLDSIET
jgi:hypothetical protein